MKPRPAPAAILLRRFLQPQPLSSNGTLWVQTHHRRTWHMWHRLFSSEEFRVDNGRGKFLAAERRQKSKWTLATSGSLRY